MSTLVSSLRAAQNIVTTATDHGFTVASVEVDGEIRIHLAYGDRRPDGLLFADVLNLPVIGGMDYGTYTTTDVKWRTWTVVVFGLPEPLTSRRYGQCDSTCTTDCGHCKGAGRPASMAGA